MIKKLKNASRIYIYGDGKIGHDVNTFLSRNNIKVAGHIVTHKTELNFADTMDIGEYKEKISPKDTIILGLGEQHHEQVIRSLNAIGAGKNIFPLNGVGFREMMTIINYENTLNSSGSLYNLDGYVSSIERVASGIA